jgi:hypothetical protein
MVNISASASLSGGSAKKQKNEARMKERLEKSIFQVEFDLFVYYKGAQRVTNTPTFRLGMK